MGVFLDNFLVLNFVNGADGNGFPEKSLKNYQRVPVPKPSVFFSGQNFSIIPGALAKAPAKKVPLLYAKIELLMVSPIGILQAFLE